MTNRAITSSGSQFNSYSDNQINSSAQVDKTLAYRLFKFKDTLMRKNRQHLLLAKRKMDLTLYLVYANPSEYDELQEKKFDLLYSQAFMFDVTEYGISLKKSTNLDEREIVKYTDRYMSKWLPTRYIIKNKTSQCVPKQVIIGREVTVRDKTLDLKRRDRKYKY